MTYFEQLHPWCIIRVLPDHQHQTVARFRRRDDAVAYLQVLRQSSVNVALAIIFDIHTVKTSLENQPLS